MHPKLIDALRRRDDERVLRIDPSMPPSDLIWHFQRRSVIRVLVVVDGGISYTNGVGFGVGAVIDLLRNTSIGCTDITVDVAERNGGDFQDFGDGGGADGHRRYQGFRFDSAGSGNAMVLDRYDTLLLFGYNFGAPDSVDGSERAAIKTWMDAGGGVFATGDHETLGENLCAGIPKVRSMRRWTEADDVPPGGGDHRIDTNQPASANQAAGVDVIPGPVQGDSIPQPITWHPDAVWGSFQLQYRRPHEILCHPFYGPIDVMPDHPHEGLCLEVDEITGEPSRVADFPGVLPKIIATGNVVPDPPHQHAKGDVDPREVPMISVYDGWAEDDSVGRIVVDSTWHHWMDMNVSGLAFEDGPEWRKISRFFINVVKWTARSGAYRSICGWEILQAYFDYPGVEELQLDQSALRNGQLIRDYLTSIHGSCTVTVSICDLVPSLCWFDWQELDRPSALPIPVEFLEAMVLSGVAENIRPVARELRKAMADQREFKVSIDQLDELAAEGAKRGLREAVKRIRVECVELDSLVNRLDD